MLRRMLGFGSIDTMGAECGFPAPGRAQTKKGQG